MSFNEDENRKIQRIEKQRETVFSSYKAAKDVNDEAFFNGDINATSEYIYSNQMIDATNIVDKFYRNPNLRVISISKKTKVGMDGLMIEIAKLLTTHIDDNFILNRHNIRILTGMSNKKWERDLKARSPECFRDKIFHHDQLQNAKLNDLQDGLIIIDEIDTGSGEDQVMHEVLRTSGLLDIDVMHNKNIRLIVVSATIMKELYDLKRWKVQLYDHYKMTIPDNYIGHKEFKDLGIIQQFYPINKKEDAERWINEDILERYKTDYRCHIIREKAGKSLNLIEDACKKFNITYRPYNSEHTSEVKDIFQDIFKTELTTHIVLGVKGLFRRANLIADKWKLKIGATHEYYTKIPDMSVQIQGLPGRLTGFWRDHIINKKHVTGPYRTDVKIVEEYEQMFNDPFGKKAYTRYGFLKNGQKLLNPKNWENLEEEELENISGTGIPIKLELDDEILELLIDINLKKKTEKEKQYKKCIEILEDGIKNNKIIMTDVNKKSSKVEPFSFKLYNKISSIRKCTPDDNSDNYRFHSFLEYHDNREPYSQTTEKYHFSLDINFVDHHKEEVFIKKGLAFISFEQISVDQNINLITEQFDQNINISSEENINHHI
jgi:hypothetical protein